MYLLSSLNSGFPAAANGTAGIFIRGSSTRATWYSDLEGDGANSTGADITLDAYGSALVYVNQLVDVVIQDADGTAIRTYGDGVAAPNVEVRSPAFTGIDYDTAASAPGNPTNLKAMADLWLTKNGAIDWQVLFGGAATTLQVALGSLTDLVYNVKNPAYGAVGDGTTSDQTAIQAAHDAAVSAGGGIVFFPKGTYRLTSAISWNKTVSAVGIGMDLSILTMDAAAQKVLRFTAANTADTPTLFYGLGFQTAQANSTTTVDLEAAAFVEFNHCGFAKTSTATGLTFTVSDASARLRVIECVANWRSTTIGVYSCAVAAKALFERCRFYQLTAATFDGDVFLTRGTTEFRDCRIEYTTATGGTSRFIDMANSADVLTVTGCYFTGDVGTTTVIDLIPSGFCTARDNTFVAPITNRYALASGCLANGSYVELKHDSISNADAAPSLTLSDNVDSYDVKFTATGTTAPVFAMPKEFYPGQIFRLRMQNAGGGNWGSNITINGAAASGSTASNATNGSYVFVELVVCDVVTINTFDWYLTSIKIGSPN